MGGMVPLGDASRRPARVPVVTAGIIVVNVVVFVLELMRGDAFVTQWAAIPAQIVSGHHWITILTAMFMHGSWSHIIGNMIFLWAFDPEIEDLMGRGRYLVFYHGRWDGRHARPDCSRSSFHDTQPRREWGNRSGDGRVSSYLSS
jgi:membrane associated rhomboid family serine protease